MSAIGIVESVLFVASKPIKKEQLRKLVDLEREEFDQIIVALQNQYNTADSGIHIVEHAQQLQMMTNTNYAEFVNKFVTNELDGDLTKAQLESLTVIAYQGPITRPELEEIRGVNCAIILRNLLMRGLVVERVDPAKLLPVYELSFEALGALGITSVTELPQYAQLHAHAHIALQLEKDES